MVIIFSMYNDASTSDVISWIVSKNNKAIRLNTYEDIADLLKTKDGISITAAFNQPFIDNVSGVWFRRCPHYILKPSNKWGQAKGDLVSFYCSEHSASYSLLTKLLERNRWLNSDQTSDPRKYHQLLLASRLGLTIPDSMVVGTRESVLKFWNKHDKQIIIKPLQDAHHIQTESHTYIQYTHILGEKEILEMPHKFHPCMIQKAIKKNIEIRSFYLNGKFFSMGICSASDKQTCVDFRRYNDTNPNRRIPYQLPQTLEMKLEQLMQRLNINSGSIDIILGNDGNYYFLEVNPVGQFGMVSYPCNYYLEREIANFLISNDNDKQKNATETC